MDSNEYVSRIAVPSEHDLSGLVDGEVGRTIIFLTKEGNIFAWLDTKGPMKSGERMASGMAA
jgi:hypothetical protein